MQENMFNFPRINQNALRMSCYTLGAGAIGFFLRWLQHQVAFDDNGLVSASIWNVIFPFYTVICIYLAHDQISLYHEKGYYVSDSLGDVLHSSTRIGEILRFLFGIIMSGGGLYLLLTCETYKNAELLRIVAGLGILSGICYIVFMTLADRDVYNINLCCFCGFVPILLFCVWLIASYKLNDINSVVWSYGVEIVMVCVCATAFFRLAGFPFGVPRGRRTLFMCMFASYMCFVSLADSRNLGMQLMNIATMCIMLMNVWLIMQNLCYEEYEEDEEYIGGFEKLNNSRRKKRR